MASIHSLPVELMDSILQNLDRKDIKTCMLVCHAWLSWAERIFHSRPRITSAQSMERFIQFAKAKGIGGSVRHLHIVGKINYSSMDPTPWILEAPARLGPVTPNVLSLHFQNVEGVAFTEMFWVGISRFFRQVTNLHIHACRILSQSDAQGLVSAFPRLASLTIDHVRWPRPKEADRPVRPWWAGAPPPVQPLRSVEFGDMDTDEVSDAFGWIVCSAATVRHMTFGHNSQQALYTLAQYLPRFGLHSLTFNPTMGRPSDTTYVNLFCVALRQMKTLTTLRMHIMNLDPMLMWWVPHVLDAMSDLPLASVTLGFTFDTWSMAGESAEWARIASLLGYGWQRTLGRVTLIHNPVGDFVPELTDERVMYTLRKRFGAVDRRRILDVQIGTRYV